MTSLPGRWPVRRAVRGPLVIAFVVCAGLAHPSAAYAQFWKQLGFGVTVGVTEPTDGDADGAVVVGGRGGMAPDQGWGFAASLGWFEAGLNQAVDGRSRRVGEVRVRPLMAGVGYTWLRGRLATTAAVTAGIALNSATLDRQLAAVSEAGDGEAFALRAGNSFAFRPEVEVEFFLARKFALTGLAGYLFTRPDIVLSTPDGQVRGRWDASSFTVAAGLTVYPFR